MFTTIYNRPAKLTGERLYYWEDENAFDDILRVRDAEIGCEDFIRLFRTNAQPGTYEELAYFLPHALSFLSRCPEECGHLLKQLTSFIDRNSKNIIRDSLIAPITQELQDNLSKWTKSFTVLHFDNNDMIKKGSSRAYDNHVVNTEPVSSLICAMSLSNVFSEWIINYAIRNLDNITHPLQSAWNLEMSRSITEAECEPSMEIKTMYTSQQSMSLHAKCLTSSEMMTRLPVSYITDLLAVLEIK